MAVKKKKKKNFNDERHTISWIDQVNLAAIVKMKVIKVENRSEIISVKRVSRVIQVRQEAHLRQESHNRHI
jgi:hypothetical protein